MVVQTELRWVASSAVPKVFDLAGRKADATAAWWAVQMAVKTAWQLALTLVACSAGLLAQSSVEN